MAQQDLGALVVTLEAQTAAFEKGMQQATKELQKFGETSKNVDNILGGFSGAMLKFNIATTAISTGIAIVSRAFGALQDFVAPEQQLTNLESSFKAVLKSGDLASDMMERVMNISNELGTSVPQTADAVRRMAIGLAQLGSSNAEIETITKTFLKLGAQGGSIQEATNAIFQFSQALGSGVLRGDELISLLERQPLIAQKIAEYMKSIGQATEGTTGELRKLASEGKVTSQILKDALLNIAPEVAKEFEAMPKTIERSLNELNNQFFTFKADLSKELGISEALTAVLSAVSDGLKTVFESILADVRNLKGAINDVSTSLSSLSDASGITALRDAFSSLNNMLPDTSGYLRSISDGFSRFLDANPILKVVINSFTSLSGAIDAVSVAALVAQRTLKETLNVGQVSVEVLNSRIGAIANRKELDALQRTENAYTKEIKSQSDALTNNSKAIQKNGADKKSYWEQFVEGVKKSREELDYIPKKVEYLQSLLAKEPPDSKFADKLKKDIDALKAIGDPLEQFRQGLTKTKDEMGLVQGKIDALYTAMAQEPPGSVLFEKYRKDVEALKESLQVADPFSKWKKSIADGMVSTEDFTKKIDYLKEAMAVSIASGDDVAIVEQYKKQLESLEDTFGNLNDPLYSVKKQIKEIGESGKNTAESLVLVREALANTTDEAMINKLKRIEDGLLGVDSTAKQLGDSFATSIGSNASNAVNQMIDSLGTAKFSFSEFATSVAKDLAKIIFQLLIMKPLIDGLKASLGGGVGSIISIFTPSVPKSGDGSVPQRSVGDSTASTGGASMFQMRMATMNTAAASTSMPAAYGGGKGSGVYVGSSDTVVNVYNQAGAEVKTAESTNSDGSKTIDIIIEKKVKEMFGTGAMDKSMRSSYGLTRSAV